MSAPPSETLINPEGGRLSGYLRSLPAFHELLLFLVWKDLKVQVAQTALGFGWLVLRPLLNIVVLSLVFGKLAKLPSDGHPYILFLLAGYLPWSYFSGVVGKSTGSLVSNSALVTKVYFPRLLLPTALILSGFLEFLVTLVLFFALSIGVYGEWPPRSVLWLPIPMLLLLLTAAGFAYWLSALAARFRDVRNAAGYLLQMMMFLAPVIWPLSLLTKRFGHLADNAVFPVLIGLYPMVGVVEGFRRALLGSGDMPWLQLGVGFFAAGLLLASGLAFFHSHEKQLADSL